MNQQHIDEEKVYAKIACCLCGKQITPNAAAMCVDCLRCQEDITESLQKECELVCCSKCNRWLTNKDTWSHHELESAGLMALCLKKVGGLNKMKIIEAFWVWTEPHSKRLRIGIDVEKSVMDDKIALRQRVEVVYVVVNRQCLECIRTATDHSWAAVIQLRQRGGHSQSVTKGLSRLENEIWKASLHNLMLGVENAKNGLDMFFKHKNQAEKVVNFITSNMPAKVKVSKKMVSADRKSNTQKYEHVYLVDVVPLVKHDVVLIPRESGRGSDMMIVSSVSSSIHFLSPLTLHKIEMSASKYFTAPFFPLLSPTQLVSFVVLDVEPVDGAAAPTTRKSRQRSNRSKKRGPGADPNPAGVDTNAQTASRPVATSVRVEGGLLAEVEVAKESDFGINNVTYRVRTHMGHFLSAGDTVLGYDLRHSTLSDIDPGSGIDSGNLKSSCHACSQDIVLVRKVFGKGGGGDKDTNTVHDHDRISGGSDPSQACHIDGENAVFLSTALDGLVVSEEDVQFDDGAVSETECASERIKC